MKILISLSSRSKKWFDGLTKKEQRAYLTEHPNSKFGKASSKKVGSKKAVKPKTPTPKKVKVNKAPVKSKKVDSLLDEYNYNVEWAKKELEKAKVKGFPSAISAAKALLANATRRRSAYLRRKASKI